MAVYSGKYGAVNGMSTVRNWVLNETTQPAEYRASNTRAGTGRKEGVYDYTGSFEGYGGVPPIMPSEYFDFVGYTAPTTGAFGVAGLTKNATNAIVQSVTINWDWTTGGLLDWMVNFAAGEPNIITEASAAVTDLSLPAVKIVCPTKITVSENIVLWPNLTRASLTITANNPSFVNSSTQGRTGRRAGIIDWNASVTEQATAVNPNIGLSNCLGSIVGAETLMQMYIDATLFWGLKWAHFVDVSDLRVDNDTGAIIGQTNNFAMAGFDDDGVSGYIARPGEDGASNPYWWPDEIEADIHSFVL
jgi:hypothetical protein